MEVVAQELKGNHAKAPILLVALCDYLTGDLRYEGSFVAEVIGSFIRFWLT